MSEFVNNYYQGIYLTETILGNPNGDFVDNSPRNIDGKIFTTDKCIKFNIRQYLHEKETIDGVEKSFDIENFVFFYPRKNEKDKNGNEIKDYDPKFLTRDQVFEKFFKENEKYKDNAFDELLERTPDVRMFGGTFSLKNEDPKQIYGPIQISYGKDINDAQIRKLQIGAPFSDGEGDTQKTIGSESIVDDAIISYDITVNPNNYRELLTEKDLNLFKESLWYGTNRRKTTSKKTDSKLLIIIKFKNESKNSLIPALNIGELKELINIYNKDDRKKLNNPEKVIKVDCSSLTEKLKHYSDRIDEIQCYFECSELYLINLFDMKQINDVNNCQEIIMNNNKFKIKYCHPSDFLKKDLDKSSAEN